MAPTITDQVKAQVLDFAAQYPGPNAAKLVAAAEAGLITWGQAYDIAVKALAAGIAAVEGEA
jgi:hypothetical protein